LELFFVGLDSHLYHMWQSTPGGPQWSGAAGLFLAGVNEVAVGSNQDGRLQVFFNGTDGDLYTDWQTAPNGSWHGASVLGGSSTGYRSLALARNADGRLELFYSGFNDRVYRNSQTAPNGSWGGEKVFSGDFAQQIVVGQNQDGRLEIFYVGLNNDIYHNWQKTAGSDSWNGEEGINGNKALQIAVGKNQDGRLEIFYVGTNNALYHNWQKSPNGPWAGETPYGPDCTEVTVNSNADGRLELIYLYYQQPVRTGGPADNPPGGNGTQQQAVLVMNGPYYTPSDPEANQNFTAVIDITNTGNIASPAVTVSFNIDNDPASVSSTPVAAIAPGATSKVTTTINGLDDGTYQLTWTILQSGGVLSAQLVI
jgi:hypothetical protein